MMHPISRRELWHAQAVLLAAIVLQLTIPSSLRIGPKFLLAGLELVLVFAIGLTAPRRHISAGSFNRAFAVLLIGLISIANAAQLFLLIKTLVLGADLPGKTLLSSAFAIFLTNIIMFGLWYWEMDSPGLSGRHKTDSKNFEFPQMAAGKDEGWRPTFFDYLYISITNSSAFSPTDTLPLTHMAKALMGAQALISLLTVVLVTARAVNILA